MIDYTLDTPHAILHVRPKSALEQDDFDQLAQAVDPYLGASGELAGLIIEAPQFRFVRDHHKRIRKIGLVTDSALGNVAEHLAAHFVSADIRHFPAGALDAAEQWITGGA
ncbi:STAS/SEC14 domain-containing protein [Thiobacillus sp.]|uniref:STAS/SEC14 domain-containing protein n=1 Tax=Thiobacillus sp. TaxID=924 RepID=UPI00286E0B46|nr:STAS/SEC14 domain-containing protein [Thiobacillus sp.]